MAFTKYASFDQAQILDLKGSSAQSRTASLESISSFSDYRTEDGYLYVRLRAISSRVNKNHDGWPTIELAGSREIFDRHSKQSATGFTIEASEGDPEYGFAGFLGKPNFIDHNNSDPERARGVVVDSKFRVLPLEKVAASGDSYWTARDADPEHLPPSEIELLIEIDAKQFPKYAKAVRSGDIDGFSMGCDVEKSKCSHCGHMATNPTEYCSHILMKGAHHDYKTADGKRVSRRSYENCYGIKFFEISGVFEPADETALAREVRAAINNEGMEKTAENPLPQSMHTTAPEDVDTLREEQICPICGETMEGETCDVCGYVEPPKGFDNPDLQKADQIHQEMQQNDEAMVQQPQGSPENIGNQGPPQGPGQPQPGQPQQKLPGSFMQARNPRPTASVMSEMRWAPVLDSKLASEIYRPATAETVPTGQRTASEIIEATKGDTMSTKTADGPTGPSAAPDARVDTTGVGGVIEPSNEQASKADAQIDVTGIGTTGVTDVSAEGTESLPTASEGSDDSGFNTDKTTEDSGPTATYGDSDGTEKAFTDEVTSESLEGNQNKGSSVHTGYDAKPFYDQPGLSGGSANKGTQPIDASGKADDRVDVLSPVTTPEKSTSGPTKTWSGTDGNAIYRQQDPVTSESIATDGFTSHIVASLKLADMEVDLDLLPKDEKYNRIAELEAKSDDELVAELNTLSRVRTAGLAKLAKARTSGVTRMPANFGRRTAAPNPDWRPNGQAFERVTDGEHTIAPEAIADDVLDSSLFSR